MGSANPQSRNGQKLGPGWIEPWTLNGDGQQLPSWAVGHIPLGKKIMILADKCPWGKGRKDKFIHFSSQNKKEGISFPP